MISARGRNRIGRTLLAALALAAPSVATATDFYVNTYFMDAHDLVIDGVCDATNGAHLCTLRAAVEEAVAAGFSENLIHLGFGTSTLTLGSLPTHELGVLLLLGNGVNDSAIVGNTTGGSRLIASESYLALAGVRIAGFGVSSSSAVSVAGSGATLWVENALFEQNQSANHGASIEAAYGSDLTVYYSRFVGGEGGYGEVQVDGAYFVCDGCIFEGASGENAGALYLADVTDSLFARISSSTFTGNHSVLGGGAIRIAPAHDGERTVQIVNSTLVGNTTQAYGGGILAGDGLNVTIQSSTIVGNDANSDLAGGGNGGGLALASPALGLPALENSIVWGNRRCSAGTHQDGCTAYTGDDCYGGFDSNGYNILQAVPAGLCTISGGYTATNPQLLSLAFHGGSTRTFSISATSPARDAGDPGGCQGPELLLLRDQRNAQRPEPGEGLCDLGAFEYGPLLFDDDFEHYEWKWANVVP